MKKDGPLRIAMTINGYYPRIGGAERILGDIAPLLQKQDIEVHILTRRYPGLTPFELVDGVSVHRLPIPDPKAVASLSFTLTALLKLRGLQPDIIHAHEMFSATTTAIAAKSLWGTPVVVTVHRSGNLGEVHRLRQKIFGERRLTTFRKKVDTFISISHEIDSELAEIGVPSEHRHFIPNAVDVERFAPLPFEEKRALRTALGLPDAPIVIFTGRLAPEKRVNHLITIWPAVRTIHPDALLIILGTGEEEASLKQMAGEGVKFAGRIDDVAPYLQASDLFVLPSIAEGLSVALLEAMSTGLAAVVTEVGGAPDIINHNTNGWLLPPDDVPALQEAITTLLGDTDRRLSFGQCGREEIVRNYSLPVIVTRLRGLYDQIVANKG